MADKANRIMSLLKRFENGDLIRTSEEAVRYNCCERTIYRDIVQIQNHYADLYYSDDYIVYNARRKGYHLVNNPKATLTPMESFALAKIALESRSLTTSEMIPLLNKLMRNCLPIEDYHKAKELLESEMTHYLQLHHGKDLLQDIWDIATAVYEKRLLHVTYKKLSSETPVERILKPVGIMFSEYYFYLAAYIKHGDDLDKLPEYDIPTIYRIDRIITYEILEERFEVPYEHRFEAGEFRKRIQFMTGGKLRNILFIFKGRSLEAILDRLPTAEVLEETENRYLIQVEVYGNGIDRWIRAQGDEIEIIENNEIN